MQQDIGDTVLRNSQGVVGSVAGSVYFGEGSWSSEGRPHASSAKTRRPLTFLLRRTGKTLSACRAALYSTDPEIDRNNIIHAKGGRTLGTCEWIKNHTRFQSWLNGDKRLLWIRGGPGKGKTVMSVYLTEEIASEQPRDFAYFFCTGQDAERNSASAVLRGLLWQIIKDKPNLQQYLLPYFDPPERGRATRSSEETLWNLFRDTCRHADIQRVYCLVDGVDECDEDSMHWLVDKFIGVEHHDDYRKLSLLVLSRPVVGLSDSTCITLDPDHHGQVSADVEIFVRSKARELSRKLRVDENFEENATRVLLEKSEGTFLWVGFVMSELLKKKTRSQVEKAMYSLPRGLPAVYARMLQNIEPDDQENGKKLLACIAVAFKPLSLKTLADILGCRSSATISEEQATLDAIAVCAPMLHIRDKRVDLVHQSAKDYLLRGSTDVGPVLEGFQIQPEAAHLYLARRCIQSLAEGSWLQHYSLMNWPNHAKHLGTVASSLLEQQPRFFGELSVPRDLWWRKYSLQFLGLPKVVPPRLHVACFLGNSTWVGAILFEIQHSGKSVAELVDEKCPGEWLALNYAAQSASEDIMKLLLDVASNAEHSREMLGHSLIQAVLAQREEAVRLMLTHGADANASDFDGMTALLHATILQNEVIVQILLKHGADPTINDSNGLHPLEVACQLPDGQALVELLLHDLEANALYSTILSLGDLARFPTPAGLVWLFLEAIINVNAKERNGRCRLIGSTHMAEYEFVRVVKDLLTVAANVDIHDLFGESAFHIAVRSLGGLYRSPGSMQLMRLFLETGVNVNSKGNDQTCK
jgi:hypothetical protein